MKRKFVTCPGCKQMVVSINSRYDTHHGGPESRYCFMSGMPEPVEGRTDADMVKRAQVVACLAHEVHDSDPLAVWQYLSSVQPVFVRELLMIALAGLEVEGKRVSEIWERWGQA